MTAETVRVSASTLRVRSIASWAGALWKRILRLSRPKPRRLRLCESLPLGERRFVAVVEFGRERFLLGGTPSSLVLLSRLADTDREMQEDAEPEATSWKLASAATVRKRRSEIC
jgi:flagellar protein FliO/FliZ